MNIIYLHSHDTGRYIQPYGHAVKTPHLQRLAEQGVLFRQAFCASPSCSASRASLLTGQHPHVNGMMGLMHRGFRLHDPAQHLAHTLRSHGYTTGLMGFQHVMPAGELGREGYQHVADDLGQAEHNAADFLRRHPSEPFFLDVGFTETHRRGVGADGFGWHTPGGPNGDPRYAMPPAPLPDTPLTRADFADYALGAQRLDERMGHVLDALDEAGLAERTLVICTTDHGIAFPRMKANLTDAGTGVMLIMRGPGGFEGGSEGGQVMDGLVSQIDLYPTVCELAGIAPPDFLTGRSILPLVRGDAAQVHDEIFTEMTYHAAYEPMRAVRTERYKYVRRFDERGRPVLSNCDDSASKQALVNAGWPDEAYPRQALYDLLLDPNEGSNRIDDPGLRQVAEDLCRRLETWMRQTGDPLLHGPVALPEGAVANDPDGQSAREPTL